jgi:hypothetical protein
MSLQRKSMVLMFILVLGVGRLTAAEIREGRVKLVLDQDTGRFSLYYLTDIKKERYESLFVDQDPRTSFLTLLVDDKTFRLGDTAAFRFRIVTDTEKPAIVFESSSLSVTQEFTFIRSGNDGLADGIRMDVRIENRGELRVPVGVRFLLDTRLGEGSAAPFSTDAQSIAAETLITTAKADQWWFSRNEKLGLMGSIKIGGIAPPDSLHIANWKRLNDVPWKTNPSEGRNFNFLPYSIGDSALCYYFEPAPLERGATRSVSLLLSAAVDSGFASMGSAPEDDVSRLLKESVAVSASPELGLRTDLISVSDLINRIDRALSSDTPLSDEEITALETVLVRLKERNGLR